jgi:hypothetical protein
MISRRVPRLEPVSVGSRTRLRQHCRIPWEKVCRGQRPGKDLGRNVPFHAGETGSAPSPSQSPENQENSADHQKPGLGRMRGGAGRTRACNHAVMSGSLLDLAARTSDRGTSSRATASTSRASFGSSALSRSRDLDPVVSPPPFSKASCSLPGSGHRPHNRAMGLTVCSRDQLAPVSASETGSVVTETGSHRRHCGLRARRRREIRRLGRRFACANEADFQRLRFDDSHLRAACGRATALFASSTLSLSFAAAGRRGARMRSTPRSPLDHPLRAIRSACVPERDDRSMIHFAINQQ